MANDNVLRNDVVQISFDTDLKTLTKIIDGLDELKKSVSDVGKEDGLDKIKETAEGVKDETEKATKSTEKLGKVDLSKLSGGLEKVADKLIDIAKRAGGAAFTAVKKVASVSFKALTAGIGAATAATGVLIKQSVDAYGDYEQLVGGVETLFKDSAGVVQKYADGAFKTAGISANDYMETVTSFSASLLQSLNNDTAKSAEVADMAITDMADNANKMGTPMEYIQNAYQGFAKQNYTMLDNLKLGYGGTKEEMERLLEDAQKISGVEYDMSNLSDVYKAIHVIQNKLDITGTTAKEASTTIQGSMSSMKAAWQNVLVALVAGGDSYERCVDNLVESVKTFAKNIIPAMKAAFKGIGKLIPDLTSIISKEAPDLIGLLVTPFLEATPQMVDTVVQIFTAVTDYLVTELPKLAPTLAKGVVQLIVSLGKVVISNAPVLFEAAQTVAVEVAKAIYEGFTGKEMSGDMFASLKEKVSEAFTAIKNIIQGVLQFGQQLMTALAPVLVWIGNLALNVFSWIGNNINWLLPLVAGLVSAFIAYKVVLTAINVITTIVTTAQSIMAAVCGTASATTAAGTAAVGTAAATSAPQVLAFAAAILAVGVSVLAICAGFYLLAQAAVSLANAGWGAIAVMVGMVAAIAGLAIGAAVLGTALTAGTVGFIAFGAAVALVGVGFALIGAGALMAANGLKIVATTLPVVETFGLQSAAALAALGGSLVAFGAGATAGGAGALVLGAGLMVVATALVVIATSFTVITVMFTAMTLLITTFATAASMLPAIFAKLLPQLTLFSEALTPICLALTIATVPLVAFTALVTLLAASFTILAVASTVALVAFTGITAVIAILNMQFALMINLFVLVATSTTALTIALSPLPLLFTELVPSVLLFTASITPLTGLFVVLGLSALTFTLSVTALTVVMTLLSTMMILFTSTMMTLPALLIVNSAMFTSFNIALTTLTATITTLTPMLLAFTVAFIPLTAIILALTVPAMLFTASMAALMAVMVILSPLSLLFAMAMKMLNPVFVSLSKSAPNFSKAIEPLAGQFTALIIPAGLLAVALAPVSAEFTSLATTATIALVEMTGLVTATTLLSILFRTIVAVTSILAVSFSLIGDSATALVTPLTTLTNAFTKLSVPLSVSATGFTVFAVSLLTAVSATAVINGSLTRMAALLGVNTKLLFTLLTMLKSVSSTFTQVAKAPELFTSALNDMSVRGSTTAQSFVNSIKTALTTARSIVAELSADISDMADRNIDSLVSKITQLPKKMGDGIRSTGKSLSDSLVEIWKDAVQATVSPVNKVIDGANWILKQFGSDKKIVSWTPYAHGTNGHKGGNALVNDGNGAELVQMPNGNMFIPTGRNVLIPNAPKGMKVLPAEQTASLLGKSSPSYRYADGVGDIDIWSYIDNASGLIDKITSNISYEGMSGFVLDAGKAMVSTVTGEMAIPLSRNKRKRGLSLWEQTGGMLGVEMGEYTPENSPTSVNTTTQYNNYSPQFTLNMSGSDAATDKRKVKQWIKEGFEECFEGIGRTNNIDLVEV